MRAQVGLGRHALIQPRASSCTSRCRARCTSRSAAPERDRADPDRGRELRARVRRRPPAPWTRASPPRRTARRRSCGRRARRSRVDDHPVALRIDSQVGSKRPAFGRTGRSRLRLRIRCTRRERPSLPTRAHTTLALPPADRHVRRGRVRRDLAVGGVRRRCAQARVAIAIDMKVGSSPATPGANPTVKAWKWPQIDHVAIAVADVRRSNRLVLRRAGIGAPEHAEWEPSRRWLRGRDVRGVVRAISRKTRAAARARLRRDAVMSRSGSTSWIRTRRSNWPRADPILYATGPRTAHS